MKKTFLKKVILLLVLGGLSQLASAHPFGMTVSNLSYAHHQIRFNTRILYDDFRSEFQKTAHVKGKNYVKQGFDKADKADLINYLSTQVHLYVDNKELKLNTVRFSFELHENDVFIFIAEASYKAKIKKGSSIRIMDNILLNSIKGQTHLINVFLKDQDQPSHGVITLDKANPVYEFIQE